jgi:hypothetical protein
MIAMLNCKVFRRVAFPVVGLFLQNGVEIIFVFGIGRVNSQNPPEKEIVNIKKEALKRITKQIYS